MSFIFRNILKNFPLGFYYFLLSSWLSQPYQSSQSSSPSQIHKPSKTCPSSQTDTSPPHLTHHLQHYKHHHQQTHDHSYKSPQSSYPSPPYPLSPSYIINTITHHHHHTLYRHIIPITKTIPITTVFKLHRISYPS